MLLEKFNDRFNIIIFDELTGKCLVNDKNDKKVTGIGDQVGDGLVAMFVSDKQLYLMVKSRIFNICKDKIEIVYKHDGIGSTQVSIIENGEEVLELLYPSWWVRRKTIRPAGLGQGDDEEEDFLAYVKLMISAEKRKEHLLNKYS
jgi:hypothetical protein